MCHPKKLSFDAKREGSLLHVENNEELIWHDKGLVGGEVAWVSFPRLVFAVVIDLIPTQVPAPRVFVVPNQRL